MLIAGLATKLLLVMISQIKLCQSQTSCTAIRQLPYPWVQTGSLTLVLNGTSTGNITYRLNYGNSYVMYVPPPPMFGIRTFKTARPSSFVDFWVLVISSNFTGATFEVRIGIGYSIQLLELNYFVDQLGSKAVSSGSILFYDSVNYSSISDANYFGNITRLLHVKNDFTMTQSFNTTTQPAFTNRLMIFLRGLKMTSTQGNLKDLKMYDMEYVDTMNIKLVLYKPLGVSLSLLSFFTLYYSTAVDFPWNKDIFWGGYMRLPDTGGTFYTSNIWTTSFMITGIAFMQFINDSSVIDYQSTMNMNMISTATVLPQKPYNSSNIGLKSTTTSFFHVFRAQCSLNIDHYYSTVDRNCYATCPAGTFWRVNNGKCFGCGYTCRTCTLVSYDHFMGSVSTCLSCNASHFRKLVNGKCVCNDGYFDDGFTSICRLCSSVNNFTTNCSFNLDTTQPSVYYQQIFTSSNWSSTVLPLYKSLNCLSGYILYNSLCSTCSQAMSNCVSCTNATVCTSCSQSATIYTDGKCYLCTLIYCVLCKQDNVCDQCAAGYIIDGTGCIVEPCSVNCGCGGFYLPKVNGSCSTVCGDGFKVGTQECDDNNTLNRDGCSSVCKIQTCAQNCSCTGWYFPVVNNSCSILCGDGFKVSSQQCDDGNLLNHDGCSSVCKIQTCQQNCSCAGYVFPVVNDTCSTNCGDGIEVGVEECDDGNSISGDGCSAMCVKENCSAICTCDGWGFPFANGICTPVCGDKLKRGVEDCDDGNVINYDGCSSSCKTEGCNVTCNCSGWTFPRVNGFCTTICGDGIKAGTQQCDNNNTINGDGCSSLCKSQPCNQTCLCDGYHLPRFNGNCTTICGDGSKTPTQQCDDSNTQSHDGCSEVCKIEILCNESCSCDGWVRPFVDGQCSTVCGDGMKRGKEECDDGDVKSHDGCTSTCKVQTSCAQSCLCGGWTQPYVNSSCSTICGDGIVLGIQECDDNNSQSDDGCTNCLLDPVLMKTSLTQQFLFFTQQKTYYASLVVFCMGFRIIGMQMLWVVQSFQLLLAIQSSTMRISTNIHGYSNPKNFPFELPGLQTQLLNNFNYMFFCLLGVFMVCTLLETLGECCRSGNQVMNSMAAQESALTFTKGPNGFRQKEYKFEKEREQDGNEEFTVHYDKRSMGKNELMSETQALSVDMSQLQAQSLPPTYLSRLSRKILRQLFFDMVINVQPVIFTTIVKQTIQYGLQSILNFPTLITFGISQLYFVGSLLVCWRGGEYFGENQNKFHENKFMRYWLVTSAEKVITSVVIGSGFGYELYVVGGVKLLMVGYFCVDKVYYSKAQNYRCIVVNVLHLLLYAGFIVQKIILVEENANKLPLNFMEWAYTAILGLVAGITLIFYFRELTSNCQANSRHVTNDNDGAIVHQRLFYSKKDINDSGARMQTKKISPPTSSIMQYIKSKKFIPTKGSTTFYQQKSRIASKHHIPQPQYRPSEEYDNSYTATKTKFTYKARSERRRQQNDRYEQDSYLRETENEFGQSRYAKSAKGERSFMKTRRAGRKNEAQNEHHNLNKENAPNQSRYNRQDSQFYDKNNQYGSRSAYHKESRNKNNKQQHHYRKAQTQRHVNSIEDIRNSGQQEEDYDSYGPVSIRFR